ncbi:MAG: phosphatase PAP2 family protein [Clostridiales bacterium]|nr:phosphatase PAP2 family protein [Clostridiales bacterium]
MTPAGNIFAFGWEVSLIEWLQTHIGMAGISALSAFSAFGEEILCIVILGFLYWGWNKEFGKFVGLNVLMANVWNSQIKNIAMRRRPYMDHEGIKILRVVEPEADPMNITAQGYSFPSGHSTAAAALYGSIARFMKKWFWLIPAIVLPLLVGISRIVVGAHYPTDVLGGWILGAAAVVFVPLLRNKIRDSRIFYGLMALTAIPGIFFCKSADYFTNLGLFLGFLAALPLEEKYVKFKNTRNPVRLVLRVLGGLALFLILNTVLKLPFSAAFLDDGSYLALLVRSVRYFLIIVIEFAVYPVVFNLVDRLGGKPGKRISESEGK